MKFIKENWFKIGVLLVLLLVVMLTFYYLLIFVPQREAVMRREKDYQQGLNESYQAKREQQNKLYLETCMDDAQKEYSRVVQELIDFGKTAEAKQYDLSGAFDSTKHELDDSKNECFKKNPQK